MRVFVTGATGFIGSYLVPELLNAGHRVFGLSRSPESAAKLAAAGADAVPGDLNDLRALRTAAEAADAVIHAAFNHDFANVKQHSEEDRNAIAALGDVLAGSQRPFIVSSGTGLVERARGADAVVESDRPASTAKVPRAATEEAADACCARGVRVIAMRLSQVHDTQHQGRIAVHIRLAREKGRVAIIGAGENRLPAVHVSDAVRLYRLALEQGKAGERFHAVAESGVRMRDIAQAIGAGLNLPVVSLTPEEAPSYFDPLAALAAQDLAASSTHTRERLGWTPTGPDLLTDLRQMDWAVG